jgi:signal transduction histidine kinase
VKKAVVIYVASLIMMTCGMIFITHRMLALEGTERLQALKGENERLALWRIESQLLALILRENNRRLPDPSLYSSTARPLPKEVLFYFLGDELNGITHTSWNTESHWEEGLANGDTVALPVHGLTSSRCMLAVERFAKLFPRGGLRPDFVTGLESSLQAAPSASQDWPMFGEEIQASPLLVQSDTGQVASRQAARNLTEFSNRAHNSLLTSPPLEPVATSLRAFWLEDYLLLARWNGEERLRAFVGCALDWQGIKPKLLAAIADLLPHAELVPLESGASGDHYSLANLPLRLVPGEPKLDDLPLSSAVRPSLLVAWCFFAASAIALGSLLSGVVRLSERRAAFVSAVTHELRTPLTTFRLYTDLLASPMALAADKHQRYVETLRSESERLQHLIENVLDWSRLERSSARLQLESIDWTDFITRCEPSLRDRTTQTGMILVVDSSAESLFDFVGNRTSVERILFNLVDNACKYAKTAEDRRIHLEVAGKEAGKTLAIVVRDHGPGIAHGLRHGLFKPFSKSAQQAAKTAPGVGLGLSLCRRLARDMDGDLILNRSTSTGTVFELRLPRQL